MMIDGDFMANDKLGGLAHDPGDQFQVRPQLFLTTFDQSRVVDRRVNLHALGDQADERLECFDEAASRFDLAGPRALPSTIKGMGSWRVTHDTNPIDDSERVAISLAAKSGTNSGGHSVTFVVKCQSNKTEAYIDWGDYLGDDGYSADPEWTYKYVTIRIGQQKSKKQV